MNASASETVSASGGNWVATQDADGNTYYYNDVTHDTAWTPPTHDGDSHAGAAFGTAAGAGAAAAGGAGADNGDDDDDEEDEITMV